MFGDGGIVVHPAVSPNELAKEPMSVTHTGRTDERTKHEQKYKCLYCKQVFSFAYQTDIHIEERRQEYLASCRSQVRSNIAKAAKTEAARGRAMWIENRVLGYTLQRGGILCDQVGFGKRLVSFFFVESLLGPRVFSFTTDLWTGKSAQQQQQERRSTNAVRVRYRWAKCLGQA